MNARDAKRYANHIAAGLLDRWLCTDWDADVGQFGGFAPADAERIETAVRKLQHEHERRADGTGVFDLSAFEKANTP